MKTSYTEQVLTEVDLQAQLLPNYLTKVQEKKVPREVHTAKPMDSGIVMTKRCAWCNFEICASGEKLQ